MSFTFILPPLLVLLVLAITSAFSGVVLVARGQSMLPDTLGHSVLPGLVLAAYWQGTGIGPIGILVGAVGASVATIGITQVLEKALDVPRPAALAATYPSMMSLGLIMTQSIGLDQSGFDAHSILFGSLDFIFWPEAMGIFSLSPASWADAALTAPIGVQVAALGLFISLKWLTVGRRLLAQMIFDPIGFKLGQPVVTKWTIQGLVLCSVVVCIVAAFLSVGAIMAVALFVAPALSARMAATGLGQWLGQAAVIAVISSLVCFSVIVLLPELVLPELGLIDQPLVLGLSLSGAYASTISAWAIIRIWTYRQA